MAPETPPVAVAVLPGTPTDFPFNEEKLIAMAKHLFLVDDAGAKNPDALAEDFRFEFPIVSLAKKDFIKALSSFHIKDAFPDMEHHPYHSRVDPYEPNRVWFTCRSTATFTGPLNFLSKFQPTGKQVMGAPECQSFTFNKEGLCTSYTGGYVMDRRVGNTKGLGAMFGMLAAVGGPVLAPGSLTYLFFQTAGAARNVAIGMFNIFTLGIFKLKD